METPLYRVSRDDIGGFACYGGCGRLCRSFTRFEDVERDRCDQCVKSVQFSPHTVYIEYNNGCEYYEIYNIQCIIDGNPKLVTTAGFTLLKL